jgi:aryl-alcohol dehydrogenase-like predicted oxidoreductase
VQIDDDREAEKRILPLAAEVKAGVLTALPVGRGRLFHAVRGKEIPDWARGFAESCGQFFLEYLLADPRVTAVIPGTAGPAHMADNLGTMRGPFASANATICRRWSGSGTKEDALRASLGNPRHQAWCRRPLRVTQCFG